MLYEVITNWEYDITNGTFWGSDQAKSIYGFDPEHDEFTIDEVENCIPERERVHQALEDLIEREIPYNLEFEIHPVSGRITSYNVCYTKLLRNAVHQEIDEHFFQFPWDSHDHRYGVKIKPDD